MREYLDKEKKQLKKVICNGCGKELTVKKGRLEEGCFEGKQEFGYFSTMDGQIHRFDLCEKCYLAMLKSFSVPAEAEEVTEFL